LPFPSSFIVIHVKEEVSWKDEKTKTEALGEIEFPGGLLKAGEEIAGELLEC
jgi:hypothetical protein